MITGKFGLPPSLSHVGHKLKQLARSAGIASNVPHILFLFDLAVRSADT